VGQSIGAGIGIQLAETALGKRIVSSTYNPTWGLDIAGELRLYDPYDAPNYPLISSKTIEGAPKVFTVEGDSVWVGAQINSVWSVAVYKIEADTFRLVAHAPAPGKIYSVTKDGNRIAVGCKLGGAAWYYFNGTSFFQEGSIPAFSINAIDVKIKNNYLYIADQKNGLYVYDVSIPGNPVLAAQSSGSGGWDNTFGARGIDVGPDGKIYLTDFHVGTMIIEAIDTSIVTVVPVAQKDKKESISVYPNPAGNYVTFTCLQREFLDANISLYDMTGRKLMERDQINGKQYSISISDFKPGLYMYKVSDRNFQSVNGILVKE
ncbi:MAG: T9SS type A sorting domain-containing protein, partial [Bacteroidota bacterium]|nr:T9SS type A sorting domain-containing protein [Bacteroidota bacterium]